MGNIHDAAARGDIDEVRKLIHDGAHINRPGDGQYHNKTPLMCAAENGHAEIVELLLNHGAEFHKDLLTHWNFSILRSGNIDVIDLLLRRGAEVNFTCQDGHFEYKDTALLHIDYSKDNARLLVEMFLVAGVDVSIGWGNRPGGWRNPLDALAMAKTPSVRALLYAAGARGTYGYDPRKDYYDFPQSILDDFLEPILPLKVLCRQRIRKCLLDRNYNNILIAVLRLPSPPLLKKFLLYGQECTYSDLGFPIATRGNTLIKWVQ